MKHDENESKLVIKGLYSKDEQRIHFANET